MVSFRTRAGYRLCLGQGEEPLWRDSFLSLGAQVRLSTNYAAGGPLVEWRPLTLFLLRAVVEGVGFFGTFGQLQSYRSPLDEYSDLDYRELGLRAGDSVWYEAGPDSLVSDGGWTLTENVSLS